MIVYDKTNWFCKYEEVTFVNSHVMAKNVKMADLPVAKSPQSYLNVS